MEGSIFPNLESDLKRIVEVRLHTDHGDAKLAQRWQDYQKGLTGTLTLPTYVIVHPDRPYKPISKEAKFEGASLTVAPFKNWLRKHTKSRG